jgi:hypothetical protein
VGHDYAQRLEAFLLKRGSALSRRMVGNVATSSVAA